MAKRQTRRSVSLNATVYREALSEAHRRGQSLAQLVTDLLRGAVPALPFAPHNEHAAVATAMFERSRQIAAEVRQAVKVPVCTAPASRMNAAEVRAVLDRQNALRADELMRQAAMRAESNPCRRDYCSIVEVHAADDPRHGKRLAARAVLP